MRQLEKPLMGVREWGIFPDNTLYGSGRGAEWKGGVQEAFCKQGHDHFAPNYYCTCGLYAFYDYESFVRHSSRQYGEIEGIVSAWGKVYPAAYGFRAQFMRLEAFTLTRDATYVMGRRIDLTNRHEEIAAHYGVPLVARDEISVFMQLSGGTVFDPEPAHERSDTWRRLARKGSR